MDLAGQASTDGGDGGARSGLDDRGYILAVLLMGLAIAAVWMSALLPAWRQQAMRERESELVFRGEQYARAIVLFNRKFGSLPPSIDVLVDGKFLRKKYKDPVTGKDFVPLGIGVIAPGSAGLDSTSFDPARQGATQTSTGGGTGQPGVSGVRSESTATSIRIYVNQQQYNLWPFDYQLMLQRMGGGQAGAQGGRGGAGDGRGGDAGRGGDTGRGGVGGVGGGRGGGQAGRGGRAGGQGGGARGGGGGGGGGGGTGGGRGGGS